METSSEELGFHPPPADCRLRAEDVGDVWMLFARIVDGPDVDLRSWLDRHGSFAVRRPAEAGRPLTVETGRLPGAWRGLFASPAVRWVHLGTDGVATVGLRGHRDRVRETIAGFEGDVDLTRLAEADDGSAEAEGQRLTETEREALMFAHARGYFDVPRRVRLRELAEDIGKSEGALSQLLRRATRRLVTDYAEKEGASRPGLPPPLGARALLANDQAPDEHR